MQSGLNTASRIGIKGIEEIISEYLNVFILITFIRGANMRPEP